MTKIVVDRALREKLNTIPGPVELCDESGRTFGHFLPTAVDLGDPHECPYPPDELERMRQETGGRTLAEIWKSLGRT